MSKTKHKENCERLYEKIGPSAVYAYANKNNITDWRFCRRCETGVPVDDNACLVCGNNVSSEPHITEETNEDVVMMTFVNKTATSQKLIFTAVKRNDPEYPGIDVIVNGERVATIECANNQIRTLSYQEGNEDYTTEIVFKDVNS
jgi:hypothetical protein